MARWEPNARERLERSAIALFYEHGFDAVTVPQIAVHAGLTTRTFFRHYRDKREVLFADADAMPALAAQMVRDAPPGLPSMEVVRRGLPALAARGFGSHEHLTRRSAIVAGHAGLRERDLSKMEAVVASIALAFRERGLDATAANVVAETAVGIVKVAIVAWLSGDGDRPLEVLFAGAFDSLRDSFSAVRADVG